MIKCDTCPRFKPTGKEDKDGYPFGICGMSGNIVYAVPHRIKRYTGSGYIKCGIGSCGLYENIEDALSRMTNAEVRRWREKSERPIHILRELS